MLYREDYYEKENPTNEAEVIISKHRNGPTGTVTLNWVGEYGSFENKSAQGNAPFPESPSPEPGL